MRPLRKSIAAIGLMAGLLAACSSLPAMTSADAQRAPRILEDCRRPFLKGKYRLIHAIETTLPDGSKAAHIGITLADPDTRSLRSVLMTLEGLVLIDAEYGKTLEIQRGIPPFDSRDFAQNLMEDVRLILFAPEGPLPEAGLTQTGADLCRYQSGGGTITDVIEEKDGIWETRLYRKGELRRSVRASAFNADSIPTRVELKAHGSPGYALTLKLMEAEPLPAIPP